MKYIVLLGDGMSDEPLEQLQGRTPLQAAHTPHMDRLAALGEVGLAHTVPAGYAPGSDVANLSVFGFNPADCYSGRSPLEAASMGVDLGPDDVSFRMNLVSLAEGPEGPVMANFSAGHISTEEATELVLTLQHHFASGPFSFYPGFSYRHLMVWHGGCDSLDLTPPHDISDQVITPYLRTDTAAKPLVELMTQAKELFADHPVNVRRRAQGKPEATMPWLWGQGRAPHMKTHRERFGISGAVISAVDLIKGIGVYAGLDVISVPGATGWIDTNYRGKADAALTALQQCDYVYLHVEAPDEAAHAGLVKEKVQAIEDFDREVVGTVVNGLNAIGPARLLICPDHPTPLRIKTHTDDPVPYILYSTEGEYAPSQPDQVYSEACAATSGKRMHKGYELMERLMSGT